MTDVLIATPVLSDAAAVIAGSESAAGPSINLQRIQPTDVWESSSVVATLEVDLGAPHQADFVALMFTNAQQSDTWRVRVADSQANLTASPIWDSTTIPFSPWDTAAHRRHGFIRFATSAWRWLRIDIDSTGNPNGVFRAGRLYVADSYVPTWPVSPGWSAGFIDVSDRTRTARGNTVVTRQGLIPTLRFDLDIPDRDEFYANTFRIQQLRGGSLDVVVIINPDDPVNAHDGLYYGLMDATMRSTNEAFRQYIQRYDIEGLI